MGKQQLGVDLSVILGAVIGAMVRSGQSADDVRFQVETALKASEAMTEMVDFLKNAGI
jgi:hypothetical protein